MGRSMVKPSFVSRAVAGWIERRGLLENVLDMRRTMYGNTAAGGAIVNNSSVSGLPTAYAAGNFAAGSVAVLRMRVWQDDGPARQRVRTGWQAGLFDGPKPNLVQTWYSFWEAVERSLTYRNVSYIWKTKDSSGRTIMLWALHPDQVTPMQYQGVDGIVFRVTFDGNYPRPIGAEDKTSVMVDGSTIMRLVGAGQMGELIPKTPVQLFARALGLALDKQEHEASLFQNAAQSGMVVTFPQGVTAKQAEDWRDNFESKHAGPQNAGKTKVIGNGATVAQVAMTQQDAQFIESVELSGKDIARIFDVPPTMLGIAPKYTKADTPENDQDRWLRFGLSQRLCRIESAFLADYDLFGQAVFFPGFDMGTVLRGDLQTEDTIAHQQIQDGRLLVDEWRARNGLSDLPNNMGKIPQIVPVGGSPKGVPTD